MSIGADVLTFANGDGYSLSLGTVTASSGPTFTNNMTAGTCSLAALTLTAATAKTVTFNGASSSAVTTVGPIIQATGALAVKVSGSGTVIFDAANTYTGATTVNSGTFVAANSAGSATGTNSVTLNGGVLAGTTFGGTIAGLVRPGQRLLRHHCGGRSAHRTSPAR